MSEEDIHLVITGYVSSFLMYHPTNPIPDFDEEYEEENCRRVDAEKDGQEILLSPILNPIGNDLKLKYALH